MELEKSTEQLLPGSGRRRVEGWGAGGRNDSMYAHVNK
jgi:hypothetical protein